MKKAFIILRNLLREFIKLFGTWACVMCLSLKIYEHYNMLNMINTHKFMWVMSVLIFSAMLDWALFMEPVLPKK